MVVLEFVVIDKKITDLLSIVSKLNALAKNELWDDLLVSWPSYEEVSHQLPEIHWLDFSEPERQILQKKMLDIEFLHQHLMIMTQAWRDELQGILQNTVQSRKLSDHYR